VSAPNSPQPLLATPDLQRRKMRPAITLSRAEGNKRNGSDDSN
jgi:hypothetical protein